ncbi:type II secretion system major pseudopilin GspG [Sphingomonas baiyangensis]|uniref:Type II secretion system core protein G n=1 Tax=Sphingomonas baiyangensis TaxID=2572576 RepID=A0A4U1L9V6_9SPHN|nr:type II secretion system major pseudopilin GspG [Sphingomonas baiyangensis]TKD53116.1 type II secretion system protein GspG [Sphingomonas baiyangensis]
MHIRLKQFHDSRRVRAQSVPADEAGLTLVEMIVVLAIIALVAALIVPNVIGRPDEARVTIANTDIRTISAALKMYRLDNGRYPSTQQGLQALVERPTTPPVPTSWSAEGYLSDLPQDPWGNPYAYTSEGSSFELKSLGRDAQPGGEGLDADLTGKQ